jgi:calcineurin-like phosphoesterase family protein
MGTTWFTSDLHLAHANIIAYSGRPFTNIEEHDRTLIDNWNDRVAQDDLVWVLGDLTIDGGMKKGLEALGRMKGRKRLISGNHDRCWVGKSDAPRYIPEYVAAGFEIVTPFARAKLGRHKVMLSHFPYIGDHTREDRFDAYRLRPTGTPLLHGHTHSPERVNTQLVGTVQLHVGVDAWDYAPVAGYVLEQLLETTLAAVAPIDLQVPVMV